MTAPKVPCFVDVRSLGDVLEQLIPRSKGTKGGFRPQSGITRRRSMTLRGYPLPTREVTEPRPRTRPTGRWLKANDPANVLARLEVVVSLLHLVERVLLGDQFVDHELSFVVQP